MKCLTLLLLVLCGTSCEQDCGEDTRVCIVEETHYDCEEIVCADQVE